MNLPDPLRVLFIASEADPFIKVGGLGDVAGSLPAALRSLPAGTPTHPTKIDVRLVIPFHGTFPRDGLKPQQVGAYSIPHTSGAIPVEAYLTGHNQVPVYLIRCPTLPPDLPPYTNDHGFDGHRYTLFSLAALELARCLNWPPHILHANDWHTAPAVYWLGLNRSQDAFFSHTASLLTIHNLPYMGVGASFPLHSFHLPPAPPGALPEWARHLPLPLGLWSADHIVAVSPTYAREILTPEFGAGLEGFLQTRQEVLSGILNGLDTQLWNPQDDPYLSVNYGAGELEMRCANKAALLNELGFISGLTRQTNGLVPLLAMVSRFDFQKGVDLAVEALQMLLEANPPGQIPWRAVFLGTGLPELEASARRLELRFPEQVRLAPRFSVPLSRRIFAGADVLLMPSRYEPCGLSQMIAMRYGCIPVARATGGLCDTIRDDHSTADGTGFLFSRADPSALAETITRALHAYQNTASWQALQRSAMAQDFSWQRSAAEYSRLYYSLVK